MGQDDSRIGAIALQVERNPQKGADDLAIEALVVHEVGRRKIVGIQTRHG